MIFVLGLGIKAEAHISSEVRAIIEHSDHVYYLLSNEKEKSFLTQLNPNTTDLSIYYKPGINRLHIYHQLAEHVVTHANPDQQISVVFYGHPTVFVYPGIEIVRQVREKGIYAQILPAISADACLYADLEIDPSADGCQMYEATNFLHRPIRWEPSANLILWQIGVVEHTTSPEDEINTEGIAKLTQKLLQVYPPDHEAIIYEAASHMFMQPRIEPVPLSQLHQARLTPISTLYIPPNKL